MSDKALSSLTSIGTLADADTGDEIYVVRGGNSRRAALRTGWVLAADLASTDAGKGASMVGIADAEDEFAAGVTTVENALTVISRQAPIDAYEKFGLTGSDDPDNLAAAETTALQAAIDAAVALNRKLRIHGAYYQTDAITKTTGDFNLHIEGDHANIPVFIGTQALADAGGTIWDLEEDAGDVSGLS